MGFFSNLKKFSPVAVDRKVAQQVAAPLAKAIGGERGERAILKTVGNAKLNKEAVGKNDTKQGVAEIGPAFRAVDRAGGNFTPLQVDNAVARRGTDAGVPGAAFVVQTTARGPDDGSDNRYYDSNRNATIAAAVVGAYFGAAAMGGGDAGTTYGLSGAESAGSYTSAGNYFGGLSSNASLGAYTESGAYFGGITAGEGAALGASAAPWYAGAAETVSSLAPYAKSAYRAYQTYAANQAAAEADALTAGTFDTTYQPLAADPAAKEQTALLWGAVGIAVVAGLAYANKKGLLTHA